MIFWGIIGIIFTRKYCKIYDLQFTVAYLGLSFVGIGSVAFHGTLRFHAQLLDELPMLYGSFALLFCWIYAESMPYNKKNKKDQSTQMIVALLMIFTSILIVKMLNNKRNNVLCSLFVCEFCK